MDTVRLVWVGVALSLAAAVAGCSADNYSTTTGKSGASGGGTRGRAGAGSSTGTGTGTGSGTSGSAGTTGDGGCPRLDTITSYPDCAPGQVEFIGQAANYCDVTTPVSSGLTITDFFDPTRTIFADSCGYFHTCSPPGTLLSLQFSSLEFAPTDIPVMVAHADTTLNSQLQLLCESVLDQIKTQATDYDAGLGAVLVVLVTSGSGRCADRTGWSFSLSSDAGVLPNATHYLTAAGIDPSATSTSVLGVAALYNLDPALGYVTLNWTDAQTTGPSPCLDVAPQTFSLTGQLPVRAGRFTDGLFAPAPM